MSHSKLVTFLKTSRIKAGLSQNRVAELLGYSTAQFVSNWERGVSHPPIGTLKKIARIYNISDEALFRVVEEVTLEQIKMDMRNQFAKSGKTKKG